MSKVIDIGSAGNDLFGMAEYYVERVDEELEKHLDSAEFPEQLKQTLRYMLFPRGKRLRPLLSLLLCSDLGGDVEKLLPAAAAIELIHTASLIHDDLPALDNDDMRRGRASCHKVFGEGTALLAGDLLFAFALQILSGSAFSDADKVQLIKKFSASFSELCSGQQLDILPAEGDKDLAVVHRLKTGALFSCACSYAAVASGLSGEDRAWAEELGYLIGEYFQVVDDCLDDFGGGKGRGEGSDRRNLRTTYCIGPGLDPHRRVDDLRDRITGHVGLLRKIGSAASFKGLKFVLERIVARLEEADAESA